MKRISHIKPITIVNFFGEPSPIKGADGSKVEEVSLSAFIHNRLQDAFFGKDMRSIEAALRISNAVKKTPTGEDVLLESTDWDFLCHTVRAPSAPYSPYVAVCLLPMMRAITEAKEEE